MNIRYLENTQIDRQRWDQSVSRAFNGNIYAYSWYLDAVADSWDALVEGDYDRIFPLTYRKKWGISYLYQPCFSQQLGIFSAASLSPAIVDEFLDHIPSRYRLTEIQLNSFNTPSHLKFSVRMRPNLEMELIQSYDQIRGNYSQNLKRNLKNADGFSWKIVETDDPAGIINLFRANRGKNIDTLSENDYCRLRLLCTQCQRRDKLTINAAVSDDGSLHAGAIFVRSHGKIILLFSATDGLAREYSAMPVIIDRIIQENCGSGTILDFEGSEDTNLARFYASFGAKTFYYPFVRKDSLPGMIRWLKRIY